MLPNPSLEAQKLRNEVINRILAAVNSIALQPDDDLAYSYVEEEADKIQALYLTWLNSLPIMQEENADQQKFWKDDKSYEIDDDSVTVARNQLRSEIISQAKGEI